MAYPLPPVIEYPPIQGNGIWVKLDSYGNISTSIDNITWSQPTQPFSSIDAYWLYNGIAYGAGLFLAYGNHIVIAGSALPGSSWASVITTGGNWTSADYDVTIPGKWFLSDSEGRTATSHGSYPANWSFTRSTISLPPSYLYAG